MSCDNNRTKHFKAISGRGTPIAKAFGGPGQARAILEAIFQTGRNAKADNPATRMKAELNTRLLFAEMKGMGIKPPTHSKNGLPKKDAQLGYSAIYDTISAIRRGRPLPALAQQIADSREEKKPRKVDSIQSEAFGKRHRCQNCGQFASLSGKKPHLCPQTESGPALQKKLSHLIGVDGKAFPADALDTLITASKTQPITMQHNLTGEKISASLDGLPIALSTGFVPDTWLHLTTPVVAGDKIVSVLNPEGMETYKEREHPNAIAATAAAYGLVVTPGDLERTVTADSLPVLKQQMVMPAETTSVGGGSDYGLFRFTGTEYRRKDAQGQTVSFGGVRYFVGQRSYNDSDFSSARREGIAPPPRYGSVNVGRTLIPAVEILTKSTPVQGEDGKLYLYSTGKDELLAVYDPETEVVGDTKGAPNASPEQMAAIIAHHALNPTSSYARALKTDLAAVANTVGSPLAAADSAYLVLRNDVFQEGDHTIKMGGAVQTQRCKQCGRWQGHEHTCPPMEALQPVQQNAMH
jgi:hypothetical protein